MALKVFDLACENDHLFEGWFASAESFDEQLEQGLVRCPVCQSDQIARRVSAPHLNLGRSRAPSGEDTPSSGRAAAAQAAVAAPTGAQLTRLQAQVLRQVRQIVRQAEDVGGAFVSEVRRMHAGEVETRPVRGTASVDDCRALQDEGIAVMPIPEILDDDRLH